MQNRDDEAEEINVRFQIDFDININESNGRKILTLSETGTRRLKEGT